MRFTKYDIWLINVDIIIILLAISGILVDLNLILNSVSKSKLTVNILSKTN